ncbi:hypothetical protein FA15DRAFT_634091 [Coprinopsis marcescibilis]|uniref:Uncharacterized protein n=1 Tax=Coprinopsis marcescibilis TaxID=230819 RepID=A0A5C3L6H2_COPMA|nr:hypothetical protein FA15DRAFT_634091 [Coprinopsis marcescibilis]
MPIRPAPLKLKYDNRFPLPIPSAKKPVKQQSFFATLYKANWKNVIIALAGLNVLRYAYASYNAYEDAKVDLTEHASKLATVSIALCVMYAVAVTIEIYGIIGVSAKTMVLTRAYAFLAFISAVLVTTASVMRAASFFLNAEELMYECVSLALTGHSYTKSNFRGHLWPGTTSPVGLRQARKQCVSAWTQVSWTQIVAVFIFGFFPAMIHYLMVYTYYRQTTDASHSAYLMNYQPVSQGNPRRKQREQRNGGYTRVANSTEGDMPQTNPRSARRRNNRAGNGSVAIGASAAAPTAATSRGINRPHRPPALTQLEGPIFTPQKGIILQSASMMSSWLSPGPPTYGVNLANRNIIGGIVSSCSAGLRSARYDKFV